MTQPRIEIAAVWPTADKADGQRLLDDLGPLLEAYWLEARSSPNWPFELDVERFMVAWATRTLVVVIVRADGKPAGFCLAETGSMLFSKVRQIIATTIYLRPELRGTGVVAQLREYGISLSRALDVGRAVIVWPDKIETVLLDGVVQ